MNDGMFETGTAVTVRAFHVMPGLPPPEGERHSHDYRLDVVVRRSDLDAQGMVVDLDVLTQALEDVASRLDGADLDDVVGKDLGCDAVTVELLSRWVHGRLAPQLGQVDDGALAVRVWESPVAFGGYEAPLPAVASSS
jgi:6-pyruvoyltetrahydropterin/6-carboxytetrahydropterin synthase